MKENAEKKAKARNIVKSVEDLGRIIAEFVEDKLSLEQVSAELNNFDVRPMKNFRLNLFNESSKSLDRSVLLNFPTKTTLSSKISHTT